LLIIILHECVAGAEREHIVQRGTWIQPHGAELDRVRVGLLGAVGAGQQRRLPDVQAPEGQGGVRGQQQPIGEHQQRRVHVRQLQHSV